MKKIISALTALTFIFALAVAASAAPDGPVITYQPQNYVFTARTTAVYTVKAEGENLHATWYIEYDGVVYDLSYEMGDEPWRQYTGDYFVGPGQDGNTFTYTFSEIKEPLTGAKIYCEIEDGHNLVRSQAAIVTATEGVAQPADVTVPAYVTAARGEDVTIKCEASSRDASTLEYVWYETPSGNLQDIIAVNRGGETSDSLSPETDELGVRYYVCMVTTSNGGTTYSSVIPVEVVEREQDSAPESESEPVGTAAESESEKTDDTAKDTKKDTEVSPETDVVPVTTTGAGATSLPIWAVIALVCAAAVIAVLATLLAVKGKKKE